MPKVMYPRQPKPGIKQLGKLDKVKRERDAKVSLINSRIRHVVCLFQNCHAKTGRILAARFDAVDGVTMPFVVAVAAIYCNITAEYDNLTEHVLFIRN